MSLGWEFELKVVSWKTRLGVQKKCGRTSNIGIFRATGRISPIWLGTGELGKMGENWQNEHETPQNLTIFGHMSLTKLKPPPVAKVNSAS